MKQSLNFLPREQLASIKRLFLQIIIRRTLIIISVITIFFSAALFGAHLLLEQETESIKQQRDTIVVKIDGDKDSTVEAAIEKLNQTTSRLESIQQEHIVWTNVLDKLAGIIPEGISLSTISLDSTTLTVTLNGKAATRDDYSLFEKQLRSSEYINDVDFPISFLKTNIPFGITLTFNDTFFNEK